MLKLRLLFVCLLFTLSAACTFDFEPPQTGGALPPTVPPQTNIRGEQAVVMSIIDGDTIDVSINGVSYRVRYIGINTPERDEACYREAREANASLVRGQTVTLVRDESNTDQYGRLLRYVYVGDRFVNAELVAQGYAEAVEYRPDTRHTAYFRELETLAREANVGCHPTGIFDDGSLTR